MRIDPARSGGVKVGSNFGLRLSTSSSPSSSSSSWMGSSLISNISSSEDASRSSSSDSLAPRLRLFNFSSLSAFPCLALLPVFDLWDLDLGSWDSEYEPDVRTGLTDRRVRRRRCWLVRMFRSWSVIPAPERQVSSASLILKKTNTRERRSITI